MKASQRGGGQDMATHFLNSHDNEVVEVLEVYGFVADDPHGAFAEVELQAATYTKCTNCFYSVAVNPDPEQPAWTEEMRIDHRDRMFKALGLEGQPYVAFKHIKNGREHSHYGISRIDVDAGKAVHLGFDYDRQKLVAREFCRDWGLAMPVGYNKIRGQHEGKDQLLLHEKHQQDTTGITRVERRSLVTALWQKSDSPKAFVTALEQHGYILCTGRRDYVLVDYYGGTNALPRLIDDRTVRVARVRDFLGEAFPKDQLPDVEETKQDVARYRKQFEQFHDPQLPSLQKEQLIWAQTRRRLKLQRKQSELHSRHSEAQSHLESQLIRERHQLRGSYLAEQRMKRSEREGKRPQGLARFLAKASGFALVQRKMHQREDRRRQQQYELDRSRLLSSQADKRLNLRLGQAAESDTLDREFRALALVEKRELQSLETERIKHLRIAQRNGAAHKPSAALTFSPWRGRPVNVHKAKKPKRPRLSDIQTDSARQSYANGATREVKGAFDRSQKKQNIPWSLNEIFSSDQHNDSNKSNDQSKKLTRPKDESQDKGKPRK